MLALAARWRGVTGTLVAAVGLSLCTAASSPTEPAMAQIPLYADGVVVDAGGMPRVVAVGEQARDDAGHLAAQDAWLARGTVPGPPEYADMAERALRDLESLVLPDGAALAGANPAWRYVWPRDASFTVAALSRTGHPDDAFEVLGYLQRMAQRRSSDGVLAARYLPDGTGAVPDDRGPQLDGSGWVLWAVAQWYAAADDGGADDGGPDGGGPDEAGPEDPGRVRALESLRPLVTQAVATVRANVDPSTGLPTVSSDYWEVGERTVTLGTLAPLLLGVRAAGPVLEALGEPSAQDLVDLLERAVEERFAPQYPRRLGGLQQDTSVAFLMPPFGPADPEVTRAWAAAATSMVRPGGGLAPGAGWKRDGISWTPTTAVFALTAAASGDLDQARARLDWLDAHRTVRGSLPEKVLWDGSPSAVAPLAWTASLVLLTLDELDAARLE